MPGRARLPRTRRLVRPVDFTDTLKAGSRSRDECFSVHASDNPLPYAQLGVTVSRRVSPRAVARNRIKRQIRESFRCHQHLLGSVRVVVTAQPAASASDNRQLRASLSKHWERICSRRRNV
jgi:ribonuclease P protein component